MDSSSNPTQSWNLEATVRVLLLLNNAIALGLSFACMQAIFIVLGSILSVSFLFNIFMLVANRRSNRRRLRRDDQTTPCPSLLVLAIDILGVVAFLVLYIVSMIDIMDRGAWDWNWNWGPVVTMLHASIGALVAFVMHSVVVVRNLHLYLRYRDSGRCAHCHQVIGSSLPPYIEEEQTAAAPRESLCANLEGVGEGDMLVMKT